MKRTTFNINFDNYSLETLYEMNKELVKAIKRARTAESLKAANSLKVGMQVSFTNRSGEVAKFTIEQLKQTNAICERISDKARYRIPMALLKPCK